jgi:hypothetical protein
MRKERVITGVKAIRNFIIPRSAKIGSTLGLIVVKVCPEEPEKPLEFWFD